MVDCQNYFIVPFRNDSMKVFFTIVFVSSNPASTSEVRTVLTRNTGDFVTSQEIVLLGKYILDKDIIVVGPVTVIESESNPVPSKLQNLMNLIEAKRFFS